MKNLVVVIALILIAAAAFGQNNPPQPSQNTSEPRWTVQSPNPPMPEQLAPVVRQVPAPPQLPSAPVATAVATSTAPAPGSLARDESGYSIAGSRIYTAAEVADWKASFRPVGTVVDRPPAGSEAVRGTFAYAKGVFYQQQGTTWIVVPAPVGARVKDRPAVATFAVVHGTPYWYYNGAFFVWDAKARAAVIAKAPAGAIVTSIPDTAVRQERNGEYVYGTTTFRPMKRGSNTVYSVVE